MMLLNSNGFFLFAAAVLKLRVTEGFARNPLTTNRRLPSISSNLPIAPVVTTTTALFENKLWDRMEIEEDEEPLWYCLNCVAGLEIDLLRQCRQRCADMQDVEKFVVPMVTNVRSHGARRMVKDTKVKYQGYVFAKLRLCPETYEAIQSLDLCRSWMGTINFKGNRKLPPAPVCLNEEEIEKFGLEECEAEEPEDTGEEDGIIVDNPGDDEEIAELEETVKTVYKGLRVEDMVKVTAKNKFFNEDAVVRRLKDGKIFLRFYTYGSMYEEWMDPGDVRKLSGEEILRGLSGPQQPITQRDIDGPTQGDRKMRFDDNQSSGELRRNLAGSFGGGPRNRRQDRVAGQYQRDADRGDSRNDDNWNWFKENESRGQKGAYDDGDLEIRGSQREDRGRDNSWAGGDIDSQWGRTNQRQDRREKRKTRDLNSSDWGAFVSPVKERPSAEETDDFFASLMTDLSNDLDPENNSGGRRNSRSDVDSSSSGEDDFFASLISEIEDEAPSTSSGTQKGGGSYDDFFGSLLDELDDDVPKQMQGKPPSSRGNSGGNDDDFFSSLLDELDDEVPKHKQGKSPSDRGNSGGNDDDFFSSMLDEFDDDDAPKQKQGKSHDDDEDVFASLGGDLDSEESSEGQRTPISSAGELDDFFAELGILDEPSLASSTGSEADFLSTLEADLDSQLTMETSSEDSMQRTSRPKISNRATNESSPSKNAGVSDLNRCTVPELKEMLREKGMKVTGKKAELIERLASQI